MKWPDVGNTAPEMTPVAPRLVLRVGDYDETLVYLKGSGLEVFESSREVGQMWIQDPDDDIIELNARGVERCHGIESHCRAGRLSRFRSS